MVRNGNGCAFGMVTRQIVTDIKKDVDRIEVKITQAFNHMSNRIPMWATVVITLLTSLVVGLIVKGVYG